MQTFLPYVGFRHSAECLDTKRLGKQRVEAKQILIALGCGVGDHAGNAMSRWRNHPAVCMWRGHEGQLALYGYAVCAVWRERGYRDTLLEQFEARYRSLATLQPDSLEEPWWLGCTAFHASHRSNLLRKDAVYYSRFGWGEPHTLPYLWPVEEEAVA